MGHINISQYFGLAKGAKWLTESGLCTFFLKRYANFDIFPLKYTAQEQNLCKNWV